MAARGASDVANGTAMRAEDAGVDAGGAEWIASCDRHGVFVIASGPADARLSARNTHWFCDECRHEAKCAASARTERKRDRQRSDT